MAGKKDHVVVAVIGDLTASMASETLFPNPIRSI